MKSKNSKIRNMFLRVFIAFSIFIMLFLFFVQILFLNNSYEKNKTKQLNNLAQQIKDNNYSQTELDSLSYNNGICIAIYDKNTKKTISTTYDRGCVIGNTKNKKNDFAFIESFIENNEEKHTYYLKNSSLDIKTIIVAVKLTDDEFVFLNTSLEPLDSSIETLMSQYKYIGLILLIISIALGFFISKKITNPIVEISNKAQKLANGNFDISFISNSNISEISNLSYSLEYAKKELAKTDELRKDLMANVGHDLRTPLTMIKAYAEMTRDLDNQPKEKKDENLNIIIEESDRLNMLVNDILDLSKLQSKTYELVIEKFDLEELINSIIKRFNNLIEMDGYEIIYTNKVKGNLIVNGDKKRIEQVIYNLVNNAINYTGKDKKVYINVSGKDKITIEIKDTGKGIKKDELDIIWDKYYHNEKKHKRNAMGTGLGLSIVKTILENHGFDYGVKSTLNKGTTFYFVISKTK